MSCKTMKICLAAQTFLWEGKYWAKRVELFWVRRQGQTVPPAVPTPEAGRRSPCPNKRQAWAESAQLATPSRLTFWLCHASWEGNSRIPKDTFLSPHKQFFCKSNLLFNSREVPAIFSESISLGLLTGSLLIRHNKNSETLI